MDIWWFFSGHTVYNPHWDNLFLSLWILLPFSLSLLLLHLSLTLLAHSFTLLRTTILLSRSPSSSLTHSDRLQHAHPLSHAVWPVKSHPKSMKSCPKMISLEKWKILTPLKIAITCLWFGHNICCHRLWKVTQSEINRPIWSHCSHAWRHEHVQRARNGVPPLERVSSQFNIPSPFDSPARGRTRVS